MRDDGEMRQLSQWQVVAIGLAAWALLVALLWGIMLLGTSAFAERYRLGVGEPNPVPTLESVYPGTPKGDRILGALRNQNLRDALTRNGFAVGITGVFPPGCTVVPKDGDKPLAADNALVVCLTSLGDNFSVRCDALDNGAAIWDLQ